MVIGQELYQWFAGSSLSEKDKLLNVCWLRERIAGQDHFMEEVMAIYLFEGRRQEGIYLACSAQIRKDLRKQEYRPHLFSTRGDLVFESNIILCYNENYSMRQWSS